MSLERKIQKDSEKPKLTNAEQCRLYKERKKAQYVNAGASTSSAPLLCHMYLTSPIIGLW
jgi:hypothetical protein